MFNLNMAFIALPTKRGVIAGWLDKTRRDRLIGKFHSLLTTLEEVPDVTGKF